MLRALFALLLLSITSTVFADPAVPYPSPSPSCWLKPRSAQDLILSSTSTPTRQELRISRGGRSISFRELVSPVGATAYTRELQANFDAGYFISALGNSRFETDPFNNFYCPSKSYQPGDWSLIALSIATPFQAAKKIALASGKLTPEQKRDLELASTNLGNLYKVISAGTAKNSNKSVFTTVSVIDSGNSQLPLYAVQVFSNASFYAWNSATHVVSRFNAQGNKTFFKSSSSQKEAYSQVIFELNGIASEAYPLVFFDSKNFSAFDSLLWALLAEAMG